jgi:hypothetical protein
VVARTVIMVAVCSSGARILRRLAGVRAVLSPPLGGGISNPGRGLPAP